MAITPLSDIVLDVARAADPEKYQAAVERLARLRDAAAVREPFTPTPAHTPAVRESDAPASRKTITRSADARAAGGDRRLDVYGQFEAFVLQTFVQSMLPKNATSVFGSGTAGEVWRSMLAEKVGNEIASSGQVGIARRLQAGPSHPVKAGDALAAGPHNPVPPPTNTQVSAPLPGAGPTQPAAPESERS